MKIIKLGDPHAAILRRPSDPVVLFNGVVVEIIGKMREVMLAAGGQGLAAPQVGISLSIITLNDSRWPALVNPRIVFAKGNETRLEGCLSIPGEAFQVTRATKVAVVAQDAQGREIRLSVQGTLARLLQHEIDHLNGILVDRRANK